MKLSAGVSKFKTICVLSWIEMLQLLTVYLLIARLSLGHQIPRAPLPFSISPLAASLAAALLLSSINALILGNGSRLHHFELMFDGWSKKRHERWKIFLSLIAVFSVVAFFFVGEVTQNGFDLRNWKW